MINIKCSKRPYCKQENNMRACIDCRYNTNSLYNKDHFIAKIPGIKFIDDLKDIEKQHGKDFY